MDSKELYSIREWAPLQVMDKIPHTISVLRNLNLTCVSAVAGFLALGSDVGVVFWYNRHTGAVQKLKAEVSTRITCVSIVDSVEYMVAAGHSTGQISIFQIKKELPPDLGLEFVAPCMRAKPVERYTIVDQHGKNSITCCAWSKNAMKLYSGDRQGVVVLTEIDYTARVCNSVEILAEAYEIVQLSVHQRYLLVSTLYRSIVCNCSADGQWNVTQVGQKDRKQLGDCGGIFLKRQTKAKLPLLICARPGLRFWIADAEGNVEKTLLFRDAVANSPTWEIPILNPKSTASAHRQPYAPVLFGAVTPPPPPAPNGSDNGAVPSKNFSALQSYAGQDSLVVTHDGVTLYILNVDRLSVEAVARGFRKILDFCICEKEIFVLEGERTLLRLAPMPEKPNKTAKIIFNPLMPPPVPLLGTVPVGNFEPPIEYAPDEDVVTSAEECFELPPIEALSLNTIPIELAVESPRAEQNRRLEIFQHIPEVDFDQPILHHSCSSTNGRKQKKNRGSTKSEGIIEIAQSADGGLYARQGAIPKTYSGACTDERKGATSKRPSGKNLKQKKQTLTTQPTLMEASFCTSQYAQHMPDALSPDTLQRTIAAKTETLAEQLQLPVVHLAAITDEELQQAKASTALPSPAPMPSLSLSPSPVPMPSLSPPPETTTPNNSTTSTEKLLRAIDETLAMEIPFKDFHLNEPSDTRLPPWPIMPELGLIPELDSLPPLSSISCIPPSALRPETETESTATADAESTATAEAESAEIDSFLLDFRRAGDPLLPALPWPTEPNTSNGWELVDDEEN